jgi:hypothetical protein
MEAIIAQFPASKSHRAARLPPTNSVTAQAIDDSDAGGNDEIVGW